jgi:hypothetical protein
MIMHGRVAMIMHGPGAAAETPGLKYARSSYA